MIQGYKLLIFTLKPKLKNKLKIIFYISSLLISFVYSGCNSSTDSKSANVNFRTPKPPVLEDVLGSEDTTEFKKLNLACVTSLCGTENPFPNSYDLLKSESEKNAVSAFVESQMARPIKVYMGHTIHKNLIIDNSLKALKNSDLKIHLTESQKGFYQLHDFISFVFQNPKVLSFNDKGRLIFNNAQLIRALSDEKLNNISLYLETEELINTLYNYETLFSRIPSSELFSILHQDKDKMSALKKEAELVMVGQTILSPISPIHNYKFADNIVIKKIIEKKELSKAELKYFAEIAMKNRKYLVLFNENLLVKFAKINLNESENYGKMFSKYSNSKMGHIYQNTGLLKQEFKNAYGVCVTKVINSYSALPDTKQINYFENKLKEITAIAKQMIEEKKQQSIHDQLNFQIQFPTDKNQSLIDWTQQLSLQQVDTDITLQKIKNLKISEAGIPAALFMYLALNGTENSLFAEALAFCDKTEPAFLNDAAFLSQNKIQLSWPTITNPEIGLGIIAHEVGHIVSYQFPDTVKSVKNCLQLKRSTDLYSEEDFADVFSTAVMNKMIFKQPELKTKNMSCGLIERDKNGWVAGTLVNPNRFDTHSSSFYRLIAVSKLSNSMTSQCTQYLNQKNVIHFDNYCVW